MLFLFTKLAEPLIPLAGRNLLIFTTFVSYKKVAMAKRLTKGPDKKIFGVCSGLAEYFDIDPTIIRVIFVFALVVFGSGLLLYLILAILMPEYPAST